MAVAVIQEFPIEGDDRTTTNYDRVQEALDARGNPPAGGLVQTAGFDEEAGVFRIFSVWESQEAWDAFLNDRLMPIVRPVMEQGGRAPETRVYQLVRARERVLQLSKRRVNESGRESRS